jgi:hypothetical protein
MCQVERYSTGEDWETVVLKCGCIALQAESGEGFELALRFLAVLRVHHT